MKNIDKHKYGIIIFKEKNNYYYINQTRDYIWLEDIKLIDTDPIYKDIIIKTFKPYTKKGYNMICNKLWNNNKNIVMTSWTSLNDFIKSKTISLSFNIY